MLGRLDGLLTAASGRPAADVALDYVRARPAVFGLDAADLSGLRLVRHYSAGGIEQLRWAQSYRGIPAIDSSLTANLTASGRLVNVLGEPRHDLALDSIAPRVGAADGLRRGRARGRRQDRDRARGVGRRRARDGVRRRRRARASSSTSAAGPRLGWRLLVPVDRGHVYDAVVDASSGRVERERNIVASAVDAHVYRNYPGAAVGGTPETVDLTGTPEPGRHDAARARRAHVHRRRRRRARARRRSARRGRGRARRLRHHRPQQPRLHAAAVHLGAGRRELVDGQPPGRRDAAALVVSNFHDYLRDTPEIAFDDAAGAFDGRRPAARAEHGRGGHRRRPARRRPPRQREHGDLPRRDLAADADVPHRRRRAHAGAPRSTRASSTTSTRTASSSARSPMPRASARSAARRAARSTRAWRTSTRSTTSSPRASRPTPPACRT